ncbi:hypothetical protein GGR56DRAFT_465653 [Xylariaceae sp. FL0804]|nr:hypothetical protein GGR56DRAFT_465653 [Xylariaceae sp. FL0804]
MGVDHDLRIALIRTNLALLQREIREKNHWYDSPRIVVRKRSGKIQISRLGSRTCYSSRNILTIDVDDTGSFTWVSEPSTPIVFV